MSDDDLLLAPPSRRRRMGAVPLLLPGIGVLASVVLGFVWRPGAVFSLAALASFGHAAVP